MGKRTIPDLRAETSEIELDHCSVLLERLKDSIDQIEGIEGIGFEFIKDVNPVDMKMYFDLTFQPEEFGRLFINDLGKGILLGTFMEDLRSQFDLEGMDADDQD